jgi:hypothetical protein
MQTGPVCPYCSKPTVPQDRNDGGVTCRGCRKTYRAEFFSPPASKADVVMPSVGALQETAPCAKHEKNASVANCERCGCFMCALCKIDADGQTLCPPCFERLSDEGALSSTRKSFRNYSGIASSTLAIGLLICFIMPICGGVGLHYTVQGLKAKRGEGDTEGLVGLYTLLVLSVLELLGGLALVGFMIYGIVTGH